MSKRLKSITQVEVGWLCHESLDFCNKIKNKKTEWEKIIKKQPMKPRGLWY